MTELQKIYVKYRVEGLSHKATIKAIASDLRMDEETITRSLARAKRDDERAAKRREHA